MKLRYIIFSLLTIVSVPASAQFRLDLEGGLVFGTNYNKVRILNSGGTLVNLPEELTIDPKVFYRIRAGYTIKNHHNISLLYAPLTVRYKGSFGKNVNFNGLNFPAAQPLEVFYQFNSYRLTYRYDFVANARWRVGAGLTGKIRDADVRFKNEINDTHFDNVGFVPLVNFYASYKPNYRWSLILEGDALAAKAGRAEDVFAGVAYQVNPKFGIKLGYRIVEGGADSEEVYNFNWINYASVGVLLSF